MTFDLQLRSMLAPGYLLICLALGGASGGGAIANGVLQLTAILLISWTLIDPRAVPLSSSARSLLKLGLCLVALVALQLLPLPPALWTGLPGHEVIADGYRLMKMPLPWLPISVAPAATAASALGLLPGFAIALLLLRMPSSGADALRLLIPGVAVLSVLLGLAQLVGGADSPLYFYDKTNTGLAVGPFANVNHQATLLLVALPFLAALEARSRGSRDARATETGRHLLLGSIAVLLLIGIVITGSFAAYVIVVPVLIVGWILIRRERSARISLKFGAAMLVATVGAILLATFSPVALHLGTSFGGSLSRPEMYRTTLGAIADYMPFGSGIGSFPLVYPLFEDPGQVTSVYANHAHSDYLELILETGVPGLLLLLAFGIWWARRVIAVWSGRGERIFLERAATVASAVVLVHSLVDYPARTAAITALFAASLAILAGPARPIREESGKSLSGRQRHMSVD
jgi:O-antigen ligase